MMNCINSPIYPIVYFSPSHLPFKHLLLLINYLKMSPSIEDSTSESLSSSPTHPTHPSIKALQASLQGEIVFKPENEELTEEYKTAINRYNKAFIKESVSSVGLLYFSFPKSL